MSCAHIEKAKPPSALKAESICCCSNHSGHSGENSILSKTYITRLVLAFIITVVFTYIKVSYYIELAIFLAAFLLAGYEVIISAVKNCMKGKVFDENFLMAIASAGAFAIGEHAEAVAVLIFYGVGELLQELAVKSSRKNITELMDIRPDYANLKETSGEGWELKTVSPDVVKPGEVIVVKPGEKIPLDGRIVSGTSFVDTRAITGESVPQSVGVGSIVTSGVINTSGLIEVEVLKVFAESTVSKILELVQNANSKKAESEKFITKFAKYYTPIVVFLAAAIALFPPALGFGSFSAWLYKALSFLIISCPCALVISIPISFFGGIGGAARKGILVKGGNYLEALNNAACIVFDKTGTITKGVFNVTEIIPATGVSEAELIELAATAEQSSNHPIAKSIISYYGKRIPPAKEITEKAGYGIKCAAEKGIILAGNIKLMLENGIKASNPGTAKTTVHITLNNEYMGCILISDEIKDTSKEAIDSLKNLGVSRLVMLTGDNEDVAGEIAKECGISEYFAKLLPNEKVYKLEELLKAEQSENRKVIFVGDGINDAPVLARADIGIAMGGIGSDAAIEAADVVIMNDDISKIAEAIKVARKTRVIVTQNIIFALGIKALIMLLAFLGITSIWFAVFADVGVALLAVLNAMRAMK